YDPNGNIRYYTRNGAPYTGAAQAMDDLEYSYYENTNRLRRVTDNVAGSAYSEDLENQTESDNYVYDEIGNLVLDKSEDNMAIDWTVYGKIRKIESNTKGLRYTYDASGNRVGKQEFRDAGIQT